MRKRILAAILATAMVFSLSGCGVSKPGADSNNTTAGGAGTTVAGDTTAAGGTGTTAVGETTVAGGDNTSASGYELALITDVGTIDDKSFNQGSWEGIEQYATEHGLTYKYYKPTEKSDEACEQAIDLAVKGGAKVIACPGYLFEVPIYKAQDKYPDVKFIFIDGEPQDGNGNYGVKSNVLSIFYAEEQSGYLAGYAAVTEGYKKLGFMGGIAVPAVVRFGYGFIQGADAAAKELGLAKGDISIKYTYVGNFDASPENNAKAASWYNEGIEVIFACGGGVGNSVMKAAETAGKKVIGVDVDQSVESETVITSAMKNLQSSVYNAVASYYNGTFEGGKVLNLGAADNGILLPMSTSKFQVFNQAMYDDLFTKLVNGTIQVQNNSIAEDAKDVPVEIVTVESVK